MSLLVTEDSMVAKWEGINSVAILTQRKKRLIIKIMITAADY